MLDLPDLVALLIIDELGMRQLPQTAAEDLLEIVMRRYERASTPLTSNRAVDDWGKLLADVAAVGAMLDRLLHHGHVLLAGPHFGIGFHRAQVKHGVGLSVFHSFQRQEKNH
jgi:DNA replication protein DnaC